mgnify:CR=1 FL=1
MRRKRGGIDALIEAITGERPDWYDQAECLDLPAEWFFPAGPGLSLRKAQAVCANCSVRAECLEYALDEFEKDGVWGGESALQRKKMRRERRTP